MLRTLLAVCLLALGCTPNGLTGTPAVVLIGDSITVGVITDPSIPSNLTFNKQICHERACYRNIVEDAFAGEPVAVDWWALSGASSRDFDPNDFDPADPHYRIAGGPMFEEIPLANVLVIYLGTAAAAGCGVFERCPPISPEEFGGNLADIMLTAHVRGVDQFVLVNPPLPPVWENTEQGDRLVGYQKAVRRIARLDSNIYLADVARTMPASGFPAFDVHPNKEGHAFIAKKVIRHVRRALAERPVSRLEERLRRRGAIQ